jgi:hypothetical protein
MTLNENVIVGEGRELSTHHIKLTDGYDTIGLIIAKNGKADSRGLASNPEDRTAAKTSSGSTTFYDFEKPWSPVQQDDYSGGLGNRNLEEDKTKYFAARNINTAHTRMILSGERTIAEGIRFQHIEMPGSLMWQKLNASTTKYTARRVSFTEAGDVAHIDVILRNVGEPEKLTIAFCEDDSGEPGTVVDSRDVDLDDCPDFFAYQVRLTLSSAETVAVNDVYWVTITVDTVDTDSYWMIGADETRVYTLISADAATWSAAESEPFVLIQDEPTAYTPIHFEYKYLHYVVLSPATGAPLIYANGYRGVAVASAGTDGLTDNSQNWPVNGLIGQRCLVYYGTGAEQKKNYWTIVSNTATRVTFDEDSAIEFDTTSEYVILGGTDWLPVTGFVWANPVTDVLVHNAIVYFAFGADVNVQRMQWTGSGGYSWAADGTNKAEFLAVVHEPTATQIYKATNEPPTVAKADVESWGTNLTFAAGIQFNDYKYGRITNLGEFGETTSELWVMREKLPFTVDANGAIEEHPIKKLQWLAQKHNGKAMLHTDIYLYFGWGPFIYRWYGSDLKDWGPTSQEGMPDDAVGYCSCLAAFPGMIFAGFNPYDEDDGFASVHINNGAGWCEFYRSMRPGTTIDAIWFEADVTGTRRLCIYDGQDIIYIDMPMRTIVPYRDTTYTYHYEGVFESSYYAANMYNIAKLFNAVLVFSSGLAEDSIWIELDYRLDEETEWTRVEEVFDTSPSQEVSIRARDTRLADLFKGVTGNQFQYRLRCYSTDNTVTPVIRSSVIESVSRIPIKNSLSAIVAVTDDQRNLREQNTQIEAAAVIGKLLLWATSLTPLRVVTDYEPLSDRVVFIEAPRITPLAEKLNSYEVTIVVTEI